MKIIKKHTGAIHIKNRLSLLQRKISNVLLYYAYNNLLNQEIHEISVKELAKMVGFNSNDVELLKNSLRKLVTTKIEWNILDEKNKPEWGVSAVLSQASIKDGLCQYAYPPTLRANLYHPALYAKINLAIQRTINGGYALALYENLVRFKKVGTTDWIEIQKFRELMGADKVKSYQQYKDLNKYVIKPAIKEVNRVTDIQVDVKNKRSGRQIKYLKFNIKEKEEPPIPMPFTDEDKQILKLEKRLIKIGLKRKKIEEIFGQYEEGYIVKQLDFVEGKIKNGDIKKSAAGYFISALKDDYAGSTSPKNVEKTKKSKIIAIKPGIQVLYDDQTFILTGKLGDECIEFVGGVKMNRETIINFLESGTMAVVSDPKDIPN